MAKRQTAIPPLPLIDELHVECADPTDGPIYSFTLDHSTVESLAKGICPERLALMCHDLMAWMREEERVQAHARAADRP